MNKILISSVLVAITGLLIACTLSACSNVSKATELEDLEEWDLVWISDSLGMDAIDFYADMIEEDTGKK